MKDILLHLYNGRLNESERDIAELQKTEEYKNMDAAYEKLHASFSKEQARLFEEYYFWNSGYCGKELERAYSNGVKTGMCLILELSDFQPAIQ